MFKVNYEINIREFRRSYGSGVEVEFSFVGEIPQHTEDGVLWNVERVINDFLNKAGRFDEATSIHGIAWSDFKEAALAVKKMTHLDCAFIATFGRLPEPGEVIGRLIAIHDSEQAVLNAAASEIDINLDEVEAHLLNDWEMVEFGGKFYIFDRRAY